MKLLHIENKQVNNGTITLTKEQEHHIFKVLRLKDINSIKIVDEDKFIYQNIEKIDKGIFSYKNTLKVEEYTHNFKVIILLSLIRPSKIYNVLPKLVEIGVNKIIIAESEHSNNYFKSEYNSFIDKANKVIRLSCEQSNRIYLPNIEYINNTLKYIKTICKNENSIINILHDNIKSKTLKEVYFDNNFYIENQDIKEFTKNREIISCIGPEGGWSDKELEEFNELKNIYKEKIEFVKISNYILKSDTAAIAICSLINNLVNL